MAHGFQIKQGSILPPISGTIQNEETGQCLDISGATQVAFAMRASGVAGVLATGLATYVATPFPASGPGFVAYYWAPGQTATVNWYECEFTVLFPGSQVQIVPQAGYIAARVNQRI